MKPIKITAELLISPEDYQKQCQKYGFPELENTYKIYVEHTLYEKFGAWKDMGGYDDFVNTTIEDNGNGLKLIVEEIEND
jgi:hypothetical protein